jgi:hypothetical protein
MASSAEMLAGAMGLLVCTFVDLLLYLVGNAILAPLTKLVNEAHITPLLGMAENTYVPYVLWAFLLLFEFGAIASFVYIVGRRQLSQTEYL